MSGLLRGFGLFLLPLCGWLAGDAVQARTALHPVPEQLSATERACFTECFCGIGRAEAAQECERLDYYTARFEDYLQQARRTAQRQAGLPHRLGLAGGMMLALLFW